jgi:hypothetical protein
MGLYHFKYKSREKNIEARKNYFKIGGDFCKYLACGWNPIVKIGDFIFCHGGINLSISEKYSISDINFIMRDTLYGNTYHLNKSYFHELFLDTNSILWNRTYSTPPNKFQEFHLKNRLSKTLHNYHAKYLVVGHTPQENGIKMNFDGMVICIDTGMSEAFGKKKNKLERIHFIEIIPDSNNKILIY